MKRFLAFSLCLLVSGASFAQKGATNAKKNNHKSAIAGVLQNMHRQPLIGVQAFIYRKDSIMASGYTDSTGYYETNSTFPGVYDLKLVYPSSKVMMITGVPIKAATLTMVDFRANPPEADTTVSYATIAPKVEKKKTTSKPK